MRPATNTYHQHQSADERALADWLGSKAAGACACAAAHAQFESAPIADDDVTESSDRTHRRALATARQDARAVLVVATLLTRRGRVGLVDG